MRLTIKGGLQLSYVNDSNGHYDIGHKGLYTPISRNIMTNDRWTGQHWSHYTSDRIMHTQDSPMPVGTNGQPVWSDLTKKPVQ